MTALFDPASLVDSQSRDESARDDRPAAHAPRAAEPSASPAEPAAPPYERSRYQRTHGSDPVATLGALLLGLGTVVAFATMNPRFKAAEKREPTVVTLLALPDEPPPAPPPAAPPPPDAPPPVARIMAPTPVIALPQRPVLAAPPAVQPAAAPAAAPGPAAAPAVAPRAPENLGDLSARVISKPTMRIPRESQRLHEEGTVLLAVLLSPEGRVVDISVARSCGFPRLDRAALDYVRDWRWSPFIKDGQPVMVRGMVPIEIRGPRGGRGRGGHGRDHDRFDDDRPDRERAGDPI